RGGGRARGRGLGVGRGDEATERGLDRLGGGEGGEVAAAGADQLGADRQAALAVLRGRAAGRGRGGRPAAGGGERDPAQRGEVGRLCSVGERQRALLERAMVVREGGDRPDRRQDHVDPLEQRRDTGGGLGADLVGGDPIEVALGVVGGEAGPAVG